MQHRNYGTAPDRWEEMVAFIVKIASEVLKADVSGLKGYQTSIRLLI